MEGGGGVGCKQRGRCGSVEWSYSEVKYMKCTGCFGFVFLLLVVVVVVCLPEDNLV